MPSSQNDHLLGVPAEQRMKREVHALRAMQGITPAILGVSGLTIQEELIFGTIQEEEPVKNFREYGALLALIHRPVCRQFSITRSQIERRYAMSLERAKTILDYYEINPDISIDWQEL